jgi:hypothetical protein
MGLYLVKLAITRERVCQGRLVPSSNTVSLTPVRVPVGEMEGEEGVVRSLEPVPCIDGHGYDQAS